MDASARQSLPSGTEVTYSRGPSGGGARGLPLLLRGMRTAEWDAMDPNDDPLTFDVWIKSETEEVWKLMAEEIERTIHTWDSTSMPDGAYRLRIVVSDGGGNPPGEEATDERVSAIFTVDNTPPEIASFEVRRSGTAAHVRGSAVDSSSPIVGVECSLDYGEWVPAFAEDMMFDSLREGFRFSFDDVPEGEHAVAVRVLDRSGNTAVARRILD